MVEATTLTRPRRIGVLIPLAGGFYFGDVLLGIEAAAVRHGIQLIVTQTSIPWPTAARGHPVLGPYTPVAADHVDGFIVVINAIGPRDLLALMATGKPVVTTPSTHPAPDGVSVHPDNAGGTATAVRHLLRHGHRRIAFVGCLAQDEMRDRHAGYLAALEQYGIEPDPALTFNVPDNLESGGLAAATQMLEAGVPLTAVCAATDLNALAIQDAFQAAGIRVPEDVAIVGFDDCEQAQQAVPALTTVRQRFDAVGAAAVDAIVDLLDRRPVQSSIVLPTTFVRRHSCGCADTPLTDTEPSIDWLSDRWRVELATTLALRLVVPVRPEPGTPPERLWPGVTALVAALDAAASRNEGPSVTALDRAWQAATHHTRTAETLSSLVDLLEFAAHARQGADAGSELHPVLRGFIAQCRLQMLRSCVIDLHPPAGVKGIVSHVGRAFLRRSSEDRAHLSWMRLVPALEGCLGLWDAAGAPQAPAPAPEQPAGPIGWALGEQVADARAFRPGTLLRVSHSWHASPGLAIRPGAIVRPEAFPPVEWLDAARAGGGPGTALIMPIGTPDRDWGFLASVDAADARYFESFETLSQGATELTVALEHDALLEAVEQQRRQVAESEARYRSLFDNPHTVMLLIDPAAGRVVDANPAAAAYYGYSREEFVGRPITSLRVPGSGASSEVIVKLTSNQAVKGVAHCLRDGSVRVVDIYGGPIVVAGRDLVYAIVHDVTEQNRAELRLQERERYFRALVEQSTDLVLVVEADGMVRYASPSHERLLGLAPAQIEGILATDLLDPDSVGRLVRALQAAGNATEPVEAGELTIRHADGGVRILHTVVTSRLTDPAVCGLILNSYDITARKRMETVLAEQALSDSLTGLPNRRLLMDELAQAVAIARRDGSTFGLLMLDLDHFKDVNDALGHHVGDLLLRELAHRLRTATRDTDTVARLGGDEFAILQRGDAGSSGAVALARRIAAALNVPATVEGTRLSVRASVGISLFPDHAADAESLLRRADAAMYRAKRLERGFALYADDAADRPDPPAGPQGAELRRHDEPDGAQHVERRRGKTRGGGHASAA